MQTLKGSAARKKIVIHFIVNNPADMLTTWMTVYPVGRMN
jgi:hypothetical protein